MSDPVKSATGRGTRRSAQARATRRRIIDGARELFLRQGYSSTTLDQIAAAAGVAVQTVYFHFGNKATVLKEIIDVLSVGDDEPIPVLDRPWVEQVRDEPDGHRALAIWLANSRVIFGRVAPIMKIVRDAAGSDAEMAAQWETNQGQRYTAHRTLAGQLADKQALRPDLSTEEAADIIFTLVSFEVYLLLTGVRGWTPGQWERWIHTIIAAAILR
ncbi:TetR/AcrR family transcriptional regulator [Nonomuraea turcica]|uniref:TetR/AcrR family transcriptional regulator n=1 Tax=Nonomuraea sp. G32 TaxID=3067274 RepID=UPI00273C1AF7|nr:TetR/AcrR family transcriptional regulator [Nonomuraea sp. G32]MDP4501307.1 helix-turn-helix domain-containing protein [Nonomuraea sp. G32]